MRQQLANVAASSPEVHGTHSTLIELAIGMTVVLHDEIRDVFVHNNLDRQAFFVALLASYDQN